MGQACHLEVDRQQSGVPVVGDVHQVVVAVVHAAARHMPYRLQGSLAQQGTPEGDLQPVPSIYVVPQVMEAGMVHKDMVHAVYVAMEVANLHRYICCSLRV